MDCNHEINIPLLLEGEALIDLDSVLKNIAHFADKGPSSKSYGFPSSHIQI